ncbi:MAG TPA: hypothetical protein VF554_01780 [Thermoanaerobaculia bacterium]|jgi:hypothetical protein
MNPSSLFEVQGLTGLTLLAFAGVLLFILVISFRSRAIVFCQYLKAMTGVQLKPKQVSAVFKDRGQDGVREMFLDLIIKEDLRQTGPLQIPTELRAGKPGKPGKPKSQG